MDRINQELIAQKLGVSRATVSRSLSNHPSVKPETRAEVLELAESLGYQTSPGRALARRRDGKPTTIGVLIGVPAADAAMATFPYVLKGIREHAEHDQITIDVAYEAPETFSTDAHRRSILRKIRSADWRGAILIYPFPPATVGELAEKISIVSVLEDYPELGLDSIDVDNASGTSNLVQLLASRGHRRIGFVAWRYPVVGHWTQQRFGGYAEAIFRHGLQFNQDWVLNVHKNSRPFLTWPELAAEAARLVKQEGVTAFVCAADHQAYHLHQYLRDLGLRVPEDCSITGFDGIEPPLGHPQVTSLKVGHADIGSSALVRLTSRMLDPRAPRRKILVEAQLIEGETLAPPRAP
jgi:LacI family transcriptional regulator